MAKYELTMPKMGESIIEATILGWTKSIGDAVEAEETVLEIATDKVDSEVPSPVDGKLIETLFNEGDVVPVGEVIAVIETEAEVEGADNGQSGPEEVESEAGESVPFVPKAEPVAETVAAGDAGSHRFYSPLVMNIARKEAIPMTELESIPGSGREGRVTKKDIMAYLKDRQEQPKQSPVHAKAPIKEEKAQPLTKPVPTTPKTAAAPSVSLSGNHEIVEMDRMRKLIAKNMVASTQTSAHVTSFVEADVTHLFLWRKKVKKQFEDQYGEKLTFTPLFIQALTRALRELPLVNSSVDGDNIIIKKDINMGVAVALPNDNLIVPIIKGADKLSLAGLSSAVNDLAQRARNNKLKPDELEGGTYTVSNVGTFGNVMGTPIISQPQVAIMAVGAIRKVPAVIETEAGDMIGIRHKMFLSHSYDHRIIDGALGGRFVKRVADILEAWDMNTPI